MKTLIGITGIKGSGKSTLGEMLREEIQGSTIVAFADALKDDVANIVADELRIEPRNARVWLDGHKGTVYGPLLQGWGSLLREFVSPNYWVDMLAYEIETLKAVIIPDVRYENEAAWIHANGGLIVAIEGPSRWVGDQRDTAHPSEAGVDKVRQAADVVVVNDSDLYWLRVQAGGIASQIRTGTAVIA